MEIGLVLFSSLFGIVLMTGFSYVLSSITKKRFREPRLLNNLFKRWHLQGGSNKDHGAGYIVHYAIGVLFVLVYELLWRFTSVDISWISALWLGVASGIVGVIGWQVMFSLTEHPPKIDFKGYYAHLVLAHVFFTTGVVAVYKLWL